MASARLSPLLAVLCGLACACASESGEPISPAALGAPVSSSALGGAGNAGGEVTTTHMNEPFAAVVSACDGDVVALSGRAHHKVVAVVTPRERARFQLHTNLEGVEGVGVPSGTRYRMIGVPAAIYDYDVGGLPPFETNHIIDHRLIGSGARNDQLVRVRFHITIAAGGRVSVVRHDTRAACEV